MTVFVYGNRRECAKAVKGSDYVRLYDANGACISELLGITSFDGYEIEGGEWETPQPTDKERLAAAEAAIASLMGV